MSSTLLMNGSGSAPAMALLERDRPLAGEVSPDHLALATRRLRTRTLRLDPGPWDVGELSPDGIGYMITAGFMTRRLLVAGSQALEPLGPGDIVCPWQEDSVSFASSSYAALTPTELGELSSSFLSVAARFPGVLPALFERAVRRSRFMTVVAAIDGMVGIERRLSTVLWALAERWGEVRDGGVFLPLALSHSGLAELIGSRRPSVTTACGRLERDGELERVEGGWLLLGEPPDIEA